MPRVSVIVPAFNAARFIRGTLENALSQTYRDFEVIVVDDGSTDDTREIVATFGGRVRYEPQNNGGAAVARNRGLALASGDLVAFLDADDLWYPHKLERQVAYLDAHEHVGLLHTDLDVIDEHGEVTRTAFNRATGRWVPQGYCMPGLLRHCHIQMPTVMVRRRLVEAAGGFDSRLVCAEDYLLWILIAMDGAAFGYLDEPTAMYRVASGSLSSDPRRMYASTIQAFELLLREKSLEQRCGREAASIARGKLYAFGRDLAYLERLAGERAGARRRLARLMKTSPLRLALYGDWLKTYVTLSSGTKRGVEL